MNDNRVSKKELLHAIGETSFVLDDLRLYLDTHPDCHEALAMFNEYQNRREALVHQYEKSYGALSSYGPNESDTWVWNKNGWLEGSEMN
jgi:spore coat protein JB